MKKLLCILSLFAAIQVTAQVKMPTIGEGTMAPAFPVANSILVVIQNSSKSVNKALQKNLETYYKGEYRLLANGEALNPKDTANARFFIVPMDRTTTTARNTFGDRFTDTGYKLIITDKVTLTYYESDVSSNYDRLFKEYFTKLEKLRVEPK